MVLSGGDLRRPGYAVALAQLGDQLVWSALAVALSALVIGVAVFAHVINPAFAALVAFILAASLAQWLPGMALIAVLFAAIFQNVFVSLISPYLLSDSDFNIARGYSFFILASVWLVAFAGYVFRMRGQNQAFDLIMNVTTGVLVLIGIYFLIGFIQNPLGSIIYLRNIGSAFMFFQVGLIVLARLPVRPTQALTLIAGTVILFGYVEFFFRDEWMALTNGDSFWHLSTKSQRDAGLWDRDAAERGIVVKGFLDSITIDLFNTPLLGDFKIRIARLLGPSVHAISYSYMIAFFMLFTLFRGSFLIALLLAPLLVLANAKGAIILLVLVGASFLVARIFGSKTGLMALAAVLVIYVLAGIIVGLRIGDFHVLGFMGGVYNFLENPIGHGIGVGGNLSTNFSELKWSDYQAAGRTPIAIESAVGVMLYQMGIAALAYFGVCIWLAFKVVKLAANTGQSLHLAAGFALLTVLVNGIFQEEALFSPSALGLIIALNGMILGAAIRTGALR
ncbi:MAG: hypothetical protein H2045_05300 [Rhizobiales bacterium]|nr:hypothetical protein [Hyphomicrobiales bacterium]